jgi:hypothetical protein
MAKRRSTELESVECDRAGSCDVHHCSHGKPHSPNRFCIYGHCNRVKSKGSETVACYCVPVAVFTTLAA